MTFDRSRLPQPADHWDREGLKLTGHGKWRTTECRMHGGSDSLRVNLETGAFVCMAGCGLKGGDVLGYRMQMHGEDFVDACKALGCWVEDGKPSRVKPLPFSARSALEVVRFEVLFVAVAACNLARGIELASADRDRLVKAAGRLQLIAEETGK